MFRSLLVLAVWAIAFGCAGDVLVMTWNMRWFPSGLADLWNADAIAFAQEVRDEETMSNLVEAVGVDGLKVVSVSNFKDGDVPVWQQVAILSTLPVIDKGYAVWSRGSGVVIPRGFAYAVLDGGEAGPIACFSLHLKSNVNRGGADVENQTNIYRREAASAQVLAVVKKMRDAFPGKNLRVVVGGDFNTNDDDLEYVSESTLSAGRSIPVSPCRTTTSSPCGSGRCWAFENPVRQKEN